MVNISCKSGSCICIHENRARIFFEDIVCPRIIGSTNSTKIYIGTIIKSIVNEVYIINNYRISCSVVYISYGIGTKWTTCSSWILEIIIIAINIICLFHSNSSSIDEEITISNIIVSISKTQHSILLVSESAKTDCVFLWFNRNSFTIT